MNTYALTHCPGEMTDRFEDSFRIIEDGYVPVVCFDLADRAPYCTVSFSYLDY